jgi:flagella basal body P-ring formation protein FlgA
MMWRVLALVLLPGMAMADSLVATRTIRAQSILGPDDLVLVAAAIPGALTSTEDALGLEARVSIYAGRPIRPSDLGPPSVIDRNQIVPLVFATGGLNILTEGRALDRGGIGDIIRIMNIGSRATVTGRISGDGRVHVGAIE